MKKILLSTLLFGIVLNANAVIIDQDTYLSDTNTGLDWLDVTITTGDSFLDVSDRLALSGDLYGWRYATETEFNQLLSNWSGIEFTGVLLHDDTLFAGLIDLLGPNQIGDYGNIQTVGLIDKVMGPDTHVEAAINAAVGVGQHYSTSTEDHLPDSFSSPYFGSFLVRATEPTVEVPEITSIALMSIGLLFGFVFHRNGRE